MDYNYSNSYLSNLNLETIDSPPESASQNVNNMSNDLTLFTNTEFFDFDVFANDEFAFKETKQVQQRPQSYQQSEDFQQPELKQEFSEEQEFLNALLSNNNVSYVPSPSPVSSKQHLNVVSDARVSKDSNNGALDDKRKRNTLASARFRIKKKLKEQKMEQELNELNNKVNELKSVVLKLEMENKCLKNLVIEKNEKKSDELLSSIKKNASA